MMRAFSRKNEKGFTLIELLVVIAIIGILSSAVLASLNTARMKARDAKKIADFRQIANALTLFYDKNGRMPLNYNPCCGAPEGTTHYNQSMGELVADKFLPAIPASPGGQVYAYYDYGGSIGALLVTRLEAAPDTVSGIPPSCRPWAPSVNWCDAASSKYYCLCVPY